MRDTDDLTSRAYAVRRLLEDLADLWLCSAEATLRGRESGGDGFFQNSLHTHGGLEWPFDVAQAHNR